MPRRTRSTPKLCKDRKQAYVTIDGQRIQCGRWGTAESRRAYDQLIAEWLHNERRLPNTTAEDAPEYVTVNAVLVAYWRRAKHRYRRGNTRDTIRYALKRLRKLYGNEPAEAFGPKRLEVVRSSLVRDKLSRSTINTYLGYMKAAFRYAAAQEMIDARVYRRLLVLEPLREADLQKPKKHVPPVPRPHIRRVRRHLPRQVRSLIALQLLSGARAGELVALRSIDIENTSADVWIYRPTDHKNAHRGKTRTIYFGPRAQRILRMFMGPDRPLKQPLLSPREANAEQRRREARDGRRPSQKPNPTQTPRVIGVNYTTASYRRAIYRACEKAGVEQWSPHQLRHNAGTFLRRAYGIEIARVILGHTSSAVTEIYAEVDQAKAVDVMRQVG